MLLYMHFFMKITNIKETIFYILLLDLKNYLQKNLLLDLITQY